MDEYISREAVVRYLKGYSEKELNKNGNFGMIISSVLNKVERALSEIPASDVQPVKRGRWIDTGDWVGEDLYIFRCSACNERSLEAGNFCPNCGARMDGESE